ncbi:MAG TPA: S1/P1 nuclease [Phycisphaerales bacterium]
MRQSLIALLALSGLAQAAHAWDAPGHRAITTVAMERLRATVSDQALAWTGEGNWPKVIADQATMPDRWRNVRAPALAHVNNPDHYIDVEDLVDLGLSLRTIEPLRHEFAGQLALARKERPGAGRQSNPARDTAKTDAYPGFLPQAISEQYARLVSNLKTMRTLARMNEPARAAQLETARLNVAWSLGVLSHFVGDAAQPLHTTRHHHGWVGDNPNGYTTRWEIHAEIDATVLQKHNLYEDAIRAGFRAERPDLADINESNPWAAVLSHIERSHGAMEEIYKLDKSGDLWKEPGKALITQRLTDAAEMLAALYNAAWEASTPSDEDVKTFVKYDGFDGGKQQAK